LNRTYPNILNFEAILGNEENFWRRGCDPDYHVQFPFIRSLAGPEDFTPGSMRNKTKNQFVPVDQPNVIPSSQGTRAHELSMYVIFDHWLGFLCDAPTEYMQYPDILDFLANVPTVWDKTVPLDSKLGEYIVTAKQTGTDWYVGGMSSWDAHDVEVDFSFLKPNVTYTATVLKDGTNASNYPTRYTGDTIAVTSDMKLTYSMAKGGGFVIRLRESSETGINPPAKKEVTSVAVRDDELKVISNASIRNIRVYTAAGQLVANQMHSQALSLFNWNKGVYIAKIQTESTTDSFKFIY
jgi:alpha-glucosidase